MPYQNMTGKRIAMEKRRLKRIEQTGPVYPLEKDSSEHEKAMKETDKHGCDNSKEN